MPLKKILLIEDEADIREVAELAFESDGGFEVYAAADGRSGIETARLQQPEIILLDVMMPELDGPSTFGLLQQCEETRHIPVIFLTAKVQAGDKRGLLALGARGIIAKPFDPLLLPEQVLEILS